MSASLHIVTGDHNTSTGDLIEFAEKHLDVPVYYSDFAEHPANWTLPHRGAIYTYNPLVITRIRLAIVRGRIPAGAVLAHMLSPPSVTTHRMDSAGWWIGELPHGMFDAGYQFTQNVLHHQERTMR